VSRRHAAALFVVAALFAVGCTSTVVLGTLGADAGGSNDLSRPIFDAFDGGGDFGDFGGGDFGDFGGGDGFVLVDLAQ